MKNLFQRLLKLWSGCPKITEAVQMYSAEQGLHNLRQDERIVLGVTGSLLDQTDQVPMFSRDQGSSRQCVHRLLRQQQYTCTGQRRAFAISVKMAGFFRNFSTQDLFFLNCSLKCRVLDPFFGLSGIWIRYYHKIRKIVWI